MNSNSPVFHLIDAPLVLLRTASVGRVCLRTPEAGMQLDVGPDGFLCWSCDPGETLKRTLFHRSFKGVCGVPFYH